MLVATALVSWSVRRSLEQRIEHELARRGADGARRFSAHHSAASEPELDAEADALGRILAARVTFIAADGRVVGDSDLTADQLQTVENHAHAPGDRRGAAAGIRRGAAPQHHDQHRHDVCGDPGAEPGMPLLAFVRLALPLTDVDRQLAAVRSLAALGLRRRPGRRRSR